MERLRDEQLEVLKVYTRGIRRRSSDDENR